jgi:xylan 1,4-beta-xylosidase
LGEEELISNDPDSWTTRGGGGAQVLFWNYTPPQTKESNQVYFKRDQPSKEIGDTRISFAGLPGGTYTLKIYRIGYGINDVYTDYLKMGSPPSLTREQVKTLSERNDGRPVSTTRVELKTSGSFSRNVPLRENDAYLITLQPLH